MSLKACEAMPSQSQGNREFITPNSVSLFGQLSRSQNHLHWGRRLHARKPPRKPRRRKPSERDRSFTSDPFTDAIILIDRVAGPYRRVRVDGSERKKFYADLLSPRNENVIS